MDATTLPLLYLFLVVFVALSAVFVAISVSAKRNRSYKSSIFFGVCAVLSFVAAFGFLWATKQV